MKTLQRLLACSFLYMPLCINAKACDITIQSRWENLETPRETKLFGSQWILAAVITFKRTPEIKEPIFINKLQFAWNGPKLFNLSASLYKKEPNQPFLPVEESLICDGKWNNSTQELYYSFNEEERLDPVTRFYIVLTIPDTIALQLQQGNFSLIPSCLPEELHDDTTDTTDAMMLGLSFKVRPTVSSSVHARIA